MDTPAPSATRADSVWMARIRFWLAIAVVWLLCHYLGGWAVAHGITRPLTLVASPWGPLGGIAMIAAMWAGTCLAALLLRDGSPRRTLLALGLGLAIWLFEAGGQTGTMDAWLVRSNPVPGPPRGAPYAWLLFDYLYLAIGLAGAYAIAAILTLPRGRALRTAFGLTASADERNRGVSALFVTLAVAAVVAYVLMGPVLQPTYRGQVYFAAGLGFIAGVAAAKRLFHTIEPLWYVFTPLLLGVAGLLVAAFSPALQVPPEYRQQNVLVAWSLARPLPLEMIAIGLVGTLWLLKPESEAD